MSILIRKEIKRNNYKMYKNYLNFLKSFYNQKRILNTYNR